MRKRSYIVIAAVIAAINLGAGFATVPAYGQASYGRHPALQRRVSYELTTDNGGSSLCMNRSGQGTSNGTPVIAYNCGQSNDDFYFANLSTMCGGGTVTETCPFTDGSGLNHAYYGDPIVVEYAYNENKCVGGNGPSDASAKLEPCPSDSGSGGGYSTEGVLAYSRGTDPAYQVIVNRNWSDRLYGAGGGCYGADCSLVVGAFHGYRNPLTLNVADSQVQQGHPQNAASYDVWGEVSY